MRSQLIRNHGENAIEAFAVNDISNTIGGNYRYTELQAAIAIEQFKKTPTFARSQKSGRKLPFRKIMGHRRFKIQEIEKGSTHSYYMYPIRFNKEVFGISRNLFLKAVSAELPNQNIGIQPH